MTRAASSASTKSGREESSWLFSAERPLAISNRFDIENRATIYNGSCRSLLKTIPDESVDLVVTSPPYNLGKEYERKLNIDDYVQQQSGVVEECVRCLKPSGSICWQVGNYVDRGEIVPLDILLYPIFSAFGLKLRNRIVWHFEHGLHCSRRFSGRYEVIVWFTKSDDYYFDLDPVRVPQKYPGKKHFKGPKAGKFSCNPKGKNPSDIWNIPNVKHNHVEKTEHPCQFPVGLIERLVLSMSPVDGLVLDPFLGVGTTAVAAIRHERRAAGSELLASYCRIARKRLKLESEGRLRTRPMNQPVHQPTGNEKVSKSPFLAVES